MNILSIILYLVAQLLFSFQPVLLKETHIPIVYQILIILITMVLPVFIYFIYQKIKYNESLPIFNFTQNKITITISILMFIYILLSNVSFKLLPESIAFSLILTIPIFNNIFNHFINKIQISKTDILSYVVIGIGIAFFLFSKKKIDLKHLIIGCVCMLIAVLSQSITYALLYKNNKDKDKDIKQQEDFKSSIKTVNNELWDQFFLSFLIFIFISILYYFNIFNISHIINKFMNFSPKKTTFKPYILLIFIFFFIKYIGNFLFNYSYNNLGPLLYDSLYYAIIIFSMIVGYFFLGEIIKTNKFIGLLFIIIGTLIYLLNRSRKEKLPVNHPHT